MIELLDELYPTFRWFLYDGVRRFSVPLTVFGPKRAAIYVGHMYVVFNSTEHIRVLTEHFDNLIRAAIVQPPKVSALLRRLVGEADERERVTRGGDERPGCGGRGRWRREINGRNPPTGGRPNRNGWGDGREGGRAPARQDAGEETDGG